MKLNSAVRKGLMWAAVHQAWCLIGVAGLWTSKSWLFFLAGVVLLFTDYPVIIAMPVLGLDKWRPALLNFLPEASDLPNVTGLIASMFLLGGLQWFLIGYEVGTWRSKREARKLDR
jgi:hypothetical protein